MLLDVGAAIVAHLQQILPQENVAFDAESLALIARAAAGSMRDALSLTDQAIAHGAGSLDAAGVEAMLGTVRQDYLFDILDALARQDADGLLNQTRKLSEQGISLDAALQDLAALLTKIALAQMAPQAVEDEQEALRISEMASTLDAETVQLYYQIAVNGRRDLPFAPDEISGFSMTLLRMLAFTPAAETSKPLAVSGIRRTVTAPAPSPAVQPRVPSIGQDQRTTKHAQRPSSGSGVQAETRPARGDQRFRDHLSTATDPPPSPLTGEGRGEGEAASSADWPTIVASLRLGGMARMLADQCELNGMPCVTNDTPWQPHFFGRGGDPKKGFEWTYHFFWGAGDLYRVFLDLWESVPTNKVVGGLWSNDPDGNAVRAHVEWRG